MSWREQSTVKLRAEFVRLASDAGTNVRALCRRHGISPTTGYKWLARYRDAGEAALRDRSRRPRRTPRRTAPDLEQRVLELRDRQPTWGGRKLARRWVGERGFVWAGRFRRLARDYERRPETVRGLHFLAFAFLTLHQFFTAVGKRP